MFCRPGRYFPFFRKFDALFLKKGKYLLGLRMALVGGQLAKIELDFGGFGD
jgi:hypothetical protein